VHNSSVQYVLLRTHASFKHCTTKIATVNITYVTITPFEYVGNTSAIDPFSYASLEEGWVHALE
jgi:hypothetical protein